MKCQTCIQRQTKLNRGLLAEFKNKELRAYQDCKLYGLGVNQLVRVTN